MTTELKIFLDTLTEDDFKGSKTKSSLKSKAKKFLKSSDYKEYEVYNGFDIHGSLLCLVYDQV